VRELEARIAAERKELMQTLLQNLENNGINTAMNQEPAINCLGEKVMEPVVNIQDRNLSKIRLVGSDDGGCNVPGEIMRFEYQVHLDKELSPVKMNDLYTFTRIVKEDKISGFNGGKVKGITWSGHRLADILNNDGAIVDNLMRCVKVWSHLEFQIEADSPNTVCILGPRFSNPGAIVELYQSESKEEIECCAFGFSTVEKIAGHVREAAQ